MEPLAIKKIRREELFTCVQCCGSASGHPARHFDAGPDPDPTFYRTLMWMDPDPNFQFDADPCGSGSTTLQVVKTRLNSGKPKSMNGNSFSEKIRRDIEESKKTLQELEKVITSMVLRSLFTTTKLYVDHQGMTLSNNT
jgi:hypothetical protein